MDNEAATTTSLISASVPASAAKADDEKSIEKPKAEGSGDPSTDGELIVSRVAETIEPASGQSDSSAEQQMPSSEADKENELNMYQVRLQICRSDLYFSPYIKIVKNCFNHDIITPIRERTQQNERTHYACIL